MRPSDRRRARTARTEAPIRNRRRGRQSARPVRLEEGGEVIFNTGEPSDVYVDNYNEEDAFPIAGEGFAGIIPADGTIGEVVRVEGVGVSNEYWVELPTGDVVNVADFDFRDGLVKAARTF